MPSAARALSPLVLVAALAGCGHAVHAATATTPVVARSCDDVVADVDGRIATRVYAEAAGGRNVAGSVARVTRSVALARAVAHGDTAATRAALRPLLRAQIQRIDVFRGTRTLASIDRRPAIAPVLGTLRGADGRPVGTFRLSDTAADGVAALIAHLTATRVTITSSGSVVASGGTEPRAVGARISVPGAAFSSAPLSITLDVPRSGQATCSATDTLGRIGERLYLEELTSARTRHVLRIVTRDRRFARAVADDDPVALRARIVHFFRVPALHVVRIRAVTAHGRLVNDVGGPYVLAPASAPVRVQRHVVGTATLSIQDDAGYIKLMQRFTGAAVVLRSDGVVVPGSTKAPGAGPSFTFQAARFPSGPLGVTLTPTGG